jgi:bifunctional UDP-N-acetylglucosamine pyrophosphorylase/glucosamine-1-phosphate N-acetyltransferase
MPEKEKIRIIVLAAGKGVRMKSELPKALLPLRGKPMIKHLLESITESGIDDKPVIVIGYGRDLVKKELGDKYEYVIQENQLGTGHALMTAEKTINLGGSSVLVLAADQPLVSRETLERIVKKQKEKNPTIIVATVMVPDFKDWRRGLYTDFGRIIRDKNGKIKKIIEFRDADEEQRKIKELNLAIYTFKSEWLKNNIDKLENKNDQKEYYLTDLVKMAFEQGEPIESIEVKNMIEALHPNSKEALEILEGLVV